MKKKDVLETVVRDSFNKKGSNKEMEKQEIQSRIEKIMRNSESYSTMYAYYKDTLGYNAKVATVLTVFIYDSYELRNLLGGAKKENKALIDFLYESIEKAVAESKKEEITNILELEYFNKNRFSPVYEVENAVRGFGAKVFGKPMLMKSASYESSGMSAPGMAVCDSLGPDDGFALEDVECCVEEEVGGFVPMGMPAVNMVNIEDIATDSYHTYEEKGEDDVLTNPTSTFRMTNNTASVGVVHNNLANGRNIDKSMVRIEEYLNYFKYHLSYPTNRMFNIITQVCKHPDKENKRLLFVGVQGKKEVKDAQNIIILLDTSGSMSSNTKATQLAIATIVSKLKIGDILSFITYSDTDRTVLSGYKLQAESDKGYILGKLLELDVNGCTYGSKGIETAYKIGEKNFIKGGNNHIIMMTDGDLNFGVTSESGLQKLIEEEKKKGLFLSVMGTGLYNYKDDKLETIAKNGNGNYFTGDTVLDIESNLYEDYDKFMNSIAKDVKAQVEFNPKKVKSYKLIGYENRRLSHNEFKDDTVISEPFGSSGYGIALYELEMQGEEADLSSDLKYQKPVLTDYDEICTVKVRFKELNEDESKELSVSVRDKDKVSDNLVFVYIIYKLADYLRGNENSITPIAKEIVKEFYVSNTVTFNNTVVDMKSIKDLNGSRIELVKYIVDTNKEFWLQSLVEDWGL